MRSGSLLRKTIRLSFFLTLASAVVLSVAGCGGGRSGPVIPTPSLAVSVVVFPGAATIPISTAATPSTIVFTAQVYNTDNTAVTWSAMGGGSFSGSTFTAPTTPGMVTVTATSAASSSAVATVTVTITAQQTVTVSPAAVAVLAGGTQSFTASAGGAAVTWSVIAPGGGNPGMIDANGNYTAPPTPPTGGIVTVKAATAGGSGVANVTILFSNASLTVNQPYGFSYTGEDTAGFFAVAGTITFDGKGNVLSGGEEDVNSGNGIVTNQITGGTYEVGPDGRTVAMVTTSAGTATWQITVVSPTHCLLVRFDTVATGSGTLDAQNPVEFSIGSISGSYSFALSGINATGFPEAIAGNFFANGNGSFTNGIFDVNDAGTVTQSDESVAASINVLAFNSSTGRGTLTLTSTTTGTLNFVFYVVDETHLKLVETDTVPVLAGDFFSAPNSITLASLTANTTYVFSVGGNVTAGPYGAAGAFTSNGTGAITGGMQDLNAAGKIFTEALSSSGSSYSITPGATNRILLTLAHGGNVFTYGVYLTASGNLEMVELDSNVVSANGMGFPQSSTATPVGTYAVNLTGVSGDSNGNEEDINGSIAIPGNSTIGGYLDINDAGTIFPNLQLTSSTIASVTTFGRGTLLLQTGQGNPFTFNMAYYVVNSQTAVLVEVDGQRVLIGTAPLQF
jgi:hypothetical protein